VVAKKFDAMAEKKTDQAEIWWRFAPLIHRHAQSLLVH
jgi:hypothetical protein